MDRPDTIRIGLVGLGQIARTRHLPTLAASPDFRLVAVASPVPAEVPDGVAMFASLDAMLAGASLDAVAICTPPQVRGTLARTALDAGLHVLLEKPPAQTVADAVHLAVVAAERGRTLFAAWHSMFSAAVSPAREILRSRPPVGMRIVWKEDVAKWHPGVDWFWQPGGMGVFDPAMNALSIAVACMPDALFVREAAFRVPAGASTPSSATLCFATPTSENGFTADLDWDQKHGETWTIDWMLPDGATLFLREGGASLSLDAHDLVAAGDEEYPGLYRHFAQLIRDGRSDVETRPLQLVADAFMLARTTAVPARS